MASILRYISLVCLLSTMLTAVPNEAEGNASMQFLKLGKSARAVALGDAYSSVPGDISAIFYNPAGVYNRNFVDLTFTYSRLFLRSGVNLLNFAGKIKLMPAGDFALGMTAMISPTRQGTILSGGELAAGTDYNSSAFEIIASYSRGILNDNLSLGINLKSAIENLGGGQVDAAGLTGKFVVDVGVLFNFGLINPVLGTLNLGVSASQISTSTKRGGETYPVPFTIKSGLSYLWWLNEKHETLFVLEAEKIYSEDFNFIIGARYRLLQMISLSFAYEIGEELYGINTGLGYSHKGLNVAYSLDFSEYDQMHRIEVSYGIKAREKEISAEAAYYAGQEYFGKGSYEKARRYFEKALSIDPEYAPAKKRLDEIAELELKQKRLKLFEQAMETIE